MLLEQPEVFGSVLAPDRTFWEKVTALHAESFRARTPRFFSRHYSDVATILQTAVGKSAARELAMLKEVTSYKVLYYYSAGAPYDLSKPGSLVLVPGDKESRSLRVTIAICSRCFFKNPRYSDG